MTIVIEGEAQISNTVGNQRLLILLDSSQPLFFFSYFFFFLVSPFLIEAPVLNSLAESEVSMEWTVIRQFNNFWQIHVTLYNQPTIPVLLLLLLLLATKDLDGDISATK